MSTHQEIKYWGLDLFGQPRTFFTLKWHKGSLYYTPDLESFSGKSFKVSFHGRREGRELAKTHLKIDDQEVDGCYEPPIEGLKGARYVVGGGCKLDKMHLFAETKRKHALAHPVPIDARSAYRFYLSTVQWDLFLLEPDNVAALEAMPMLVKGRETDSDETLGIHFWKRSTPWIVVRYTRLRVENPRWFQGMDEGSTNATLHAMFASLPNRLSTHR